MKINEGGNVTVQLKDGSVIQAEKIPIKEIGRSKFVKDMQEAFIELNELFEKNNDKPIWPDISIVKSAELYNGSTSYIMDTNISDDEILPFKSTAGDIDIIVPEDIKEQMWLFLDNLKDSSDSKITKHIKYIGNNKPSLSMVNDQINAIFKYDDKYYIQVDFEFLPWENTETRVGVGRTEYQLKPSAWAKFGHSSSLDDAKTIVKIDYKNLHIGFIKNGKVYDKDNNELPISIENIAILKDVENQSIFLAKGLEDNYIVQGGIKAVNHKYLLRAISRAVSIKPNVVFVTSKADCTNWEKKLKKIQNQSIMKFSVQKGARMAYSPMYCDNNLLLDEKHRTVFKEIPTKDSKYTTDLTEMFELFFNAKPTNVQLKQMWSFTGLVELAKFYLSKEQKQLMLNRLMELYFETKGDKNIGQELERDDPYTDFLIKMSAAIYITKELGLKLDDSFNDNIIQYYKNYGKRNLFLQAIDKIKG